MERKYVELGGERLHYADFGGSGRALVLIHGLGGSHANWLAVGPRLAERRRVFALDVPGFGLSPRSARGTSVDVMRGAIARFIDFVSSEPVDLVGNSMGGALTILTAAETPSRVARAVLVCPALPPPLRVRANAKFVGLLALAALPFGEKLLAARMRGRMPEDLVHEMLALTCADPSRVPSEVLTHQLALARSRPERPWMDLAFTEATRSIIATMARRERFYDLMDRVTCPALVIHGARDRVVDVGAAEIARQRCPHFELVVLDDVGHVPQLETPDHFSSIVTRWLDAEGSFGPRSA